MRAECLWFLPPLSGESAILQVQTCPGIHGEIGSWDPGRDMKLWIIGNLC